MADYTEAHYRCEQDHQALFKAKCCPRVAAASCTQKSTRNPCDLDLWAMTLKFDRVRVLKVVEVHVRAKFHQAMCSDDEQLYRSRISLERIKQSTNGKRCYQLGFFHIRWKQFGVNFGSTNKKCLNPWPLTYDLDIQWGLCGCQGTCSYKISSSWVQRFMSYRAKEKKLHVCFVFAGIICRWSVS